MRRTLLLLPALAALAAPASATAAHPRLEVHLAACQTGTTPPGRFLAVTASMPALRGTARMELRFDLLERRRGERSWRRERAPKLGRWERSQPGRSGFVFTKRVDELRAPAVYRALVRFRWRDASGAVQRRAVRRSAVCRQPDLRPNLRPVALRAGAGGRWLATVENSGRSEARNPGVAVRSGNGRSDALLALLAPGERATVEVVGPPCDPATGMRLVVDPGQRIDEASERDNAIVVACPSTLGAS